MVEETGVVIWQRTLRNIDRCARFRFESDKEIRSSDPESEISGSTADATHLQLQKRTQPKLYSLWARIGILFQLEYRNFSARRGLNERPLDCETSSGENVPVNAGAVLVHSLAFPPEVVCL